MNPMIANLDSKLLDLGLAYASRDESRCRELNTEIYKIVFSNNVLESLWDEKVLLGLNRLLDTSPPDKDTYGEEIKFLRERIKKVRNINDFFYHLLNPKIEIDKAIEALSEIIDIPDSMKEQLRSNAHLADLRSGGKAPSEKIKDFLDYITEEHHETTSQCFLELQSSAQSIQDREEVGTAYALLLHGHSNQGILLPVSTKVQKGVGKVDTATPQLRPLPAQ